MTITAKWNGRTVHLAVSAGERNVRVKWGRKNVLAIPGRDAVRFAEQLVNAICELEDKRRSEGENRVQVGRGFLEEADG